MIAGKALLLVLLLASLPACVASTNPKIHRPSGHYVLPADAAPDADFCVESTWPSPDVPPDASLAQWACISVGQLRVLLRTRRYAP